MGKTYIWSEEFVNNMYYGLDIYHPHQLDLEEIAARNGLSVFYRPCEPMQLGDAIILDSRASDSQQWQDFGHELCHALWHEGSSFSVPMPYQVYQEARAENFAQFVCVPSFMLQNLDIPAYFQEAVWMIQETFCVDRQFAERRLAQYLRNFAG